MFCCFQYINNQIRITTIQSCQLKFSFPPLAFYCGQGFQLELPDQNVFMCWQGICDIMQHLFQHRVERAGKTNIFHSFKDNPTAQIVPVKLTHSSLGVCANLHVENCVSTSGSTMSSHCCWWITRRTVNAASRLYRLEESGIASPGLDGSLLRWRRRSSWHRHRRSP